MKARDNKQQEWCDSIEEDGGKKIILQLARDRGIYNKDTSAMKRSDGKLVTGIKKSAKCMGGVFKEIPKPGGRT